MILLAKLRSYFIDNGLPNLVISWRYFLLDTSVIFVKFDILHHFPYMQKILIPKIITKTIRTFNYRKKSFSSHKNSLQLLQLPKNIFNKQFSLLDIIESRLIQLNLNEITNETFLIYFFSVRFSFHRLHIHKYFFTFSSPVFHIVIIIIMHVRKM